MIRIFLGILGIWLLSGCGQKYDYTIHKPDIKYQQPSFYALQAMLKETNGKPYIWAEEGEDAFDCSGLVYYCYGSMNMWLPRVSWQQAKVGKKVAVKDLQYGDLIFFGKHSSRGRVNHVGIYIGNGYFRHASSTKEGIITTKVNKPYYRNRIVTCRRVLSSTKVIKKKKIYKPFTPKKQPKKSVKVNAYDREMDEIISFF